MKCSCSKDTAKSSVSCRDATGGTKAQATVTIHDTEFAVDAISDDEEEAGVDQAVEQVTDEASDLKEQVSDTDTPPPQTPTKGKSATYLHCVDDPWSLHQCAALSANARITEQARVHLPCFTETVLIDSRPPAPRGDGEPRCRSATDGTTTTTEQGGSGGT
jgi:hypothetical protein